MEASLPQLILPIKLEKSRERLTSLSGLLVLEELARALGVWEEVDRVLEGPKSGRGYRPAREARCRRDRPGESTAGAAGLGERGWGSELGRGRHPN